MQLRIAGRKFLVSSLRTIAVAVAAFFSFQHAASAVSYSTSGAPTQIGLGNQLGPASTFDWLQIDGAAGNITSNTIVLNKLTFTAGVNATVAAVSDGFFTETVNIGGTVGTLVVPFKISIDYSDMITILGGQLLSLQVGTNIWNLVVNGLTIGPNSGGPQWANLTAQVSSTAATPLPAAALLFGSGLGGMAFLRWRRQKKVVAAA